MTFDVDACGGDDGDGDGGGDGGGHCDGDDDEIGKKW